MQQHQLIHQQPITVFFIKQQARCPIAIHHIECFKYMSVGGTTGKRGDAASNSMALFNYDK